MREKERIFRFKQFECRHEKSAMKIGMDAVLLGCWMSVLPEGKVLDVGCGCGILALMYAQRSRHSIIEAIDIDSLAVEEASDNFRKSPWSARLSAYIKNYMDEPLASGSGSYSHIISNPPFFDAGISKFDTTRILARHQGELSPYSLLEKAGIYLNKNGLISMILPFDQNERIRKFALENGFLLSRHASISNRSDSIKPKRYLVEFTKGESHEAVVEASWKESELEKIFIEDIDGSYSARYKDLGRDFYLQF